MNNISINKLSKIIFESINNALNDSKIKLFNYLKREPKITSCEHGNTNLPSYCYFIPKNIVNNFMCVHFTNMESYHNIKDLGFIVGTHDITKLGYSSESKGDVGSDVWNFALPINSKYVSNYDLGYGDCGFIISTDGVLAHHIVDNDDEVIFTDKDVHSIVPIIYDDEKRLWFIDDDKNRDINGFKNIIELYKNI